MRFKNNRPFNRLFPHKGLGRHILYYNIVFPDGRMFGSDYTLMQRDIRIYDPDMNIVEIAEDMGVVVKRFLGEGLSTEEVAERTMFPLEYVRQYVN